MGVTFNSFHQNLTKQLELAYDKLHPRTTENCYYPKSRGNRKINQRI